jgi:hypothetical protein
LTTLQINTCQSGPFPTLVEDEDNQDESTHKNTGETDEKVQDPGLAFDDNLDLDVDDIGIGEGDCVFMAIVHLVDPHHFICTLSTVSRCLVKASTKNSKPKEFHEIVLMAQHDYANVFSEMAFDTLPQHWK